MIRVCGSHNDDKRAMRKLAKKFRAFKEEDVTSVRETIKIGVIFHICCRYENEIETAKDIDHVIEIMNKDFNHQSVELEYGRGKYAHNAEYDKTWNDYMSRGASSEITFHKIGTIYKKLGTQYSRKIHILDKNIKGYSSPIRPEQYLNIWVVDLSNGLLGYAQFPWEEVLETDGVVIASGTFGRTPKLVEYGLGKTLVHEVGHVFGLYHTFQETMNYGDDLTIEDLEIDECVGDCVEDTPAQLVPTSGNPYENLSKWQASAKTKDGKPIPHMFMNNMDYSHDKALCMFTRDQVAKMRKTIKLYKSGFLHEEKIVAIHDFDNNGIGWIGQPVFLNTTSKTYLFTKTVGYVTRNANQGNKCLRVGENGKAEFRFKLPVSQTQLVQRLEEGKEEKKKYILDVFALANNPNTVIQLSSPVVAGKETGVSSVGDRARSTSQIHPGGGERMWRTFQLERENVYLQYKIVLEEPYTGSGTNDSDNVYAVRLGVNGTYNIYSYFDNLTIREYSEKLDENDPRLFSIELTTPKMKILDVLESETQSELDA